MSRIRSIAFSTGLIGTGLLACSFAGRPLLADTDLKTPPNPLGIRQSPYGEVFAMALQGPIDTSFTVGMFGTTGSYKPEIPEETVSNKEDVTLTGKWLHMLDTFNKASTARTNPKAASEALRTHLRREAENKLRFAYNLDPSHYGNYNSLHFYLSEPAVGTHPVLTPAALKLAEQTIDYCLKQENDPRPALTAAAACTNVLHLMFAGLDQGEPKFTTAQMRQCLQLLDHCLGRYATIANQWNESDQWELLSPQRINECQERFDFITKIRGAAEQTILRAENNTLNHQAAN
jgi:hypothetical protein